MARTPTLWHTLFLHAALTVGLVLPASLKAQEECTARPGVLFAELDPVCFGPPATVVGAAYNVLPVIPAGDTAVYLLTNGPDLIVRDIGQFPAFIVPTPGLYHLHTLVYDPSSFDVADIGTGVTTLFQLNGLLIQGGGEMCGALDMEGAEVRVQDCTKCAAKAGSLAAYKSKDCLTDNTWIGAIPNGDAVVPDGYQIAYLFTQGPDHVIIGRSAEPWFQVTGPGVYYVHTIVYDPATLDLSTIVPGVTTAADVNALLTQGGGTICAGLDLLGASVTVDDPAAGLLSVPSPNVCLEEGHAHLTGTPAGGLHVPDGYEVVYLLSQGTSNVLVGISPDPSFIVTEVDDYAIHTLVYDPSTLDLSNISLGETTIAQVNGWLTQGGGGICASLDREGAPVKVDECKKACMAEAGCLRGLAPIQCLHNGDAELWAQPGVSSVVPDGYVKVYVLTHGLDLTIEQVSADPHFIVHHIGLYRIHTLVYDPNTLDLSMVQFGTTAACDVSALLIQGGGTICGALDLRGACYLVLGPWWCGWWDCHQRMSESDLTTEAITQPGLLKSIENDAPVSFNAWPNPVVDELSVDITSFAATTIQVEVFDLSGRSVVAPVRAPATESTGRLTLSLTDLKAGTYVVRVTAGDHVETVRIVKAER